MTAKGRSLQVLTIAALLFAVTAKTGLAQQTPTPTNHLSNPASAEPPGASERTEKILSLLTLWDATHISFYGKVIDGEGKAIPDVNELITTSDAVHYQKKSDDNGNFSITGIHGTDIIVSVSKPGYYDSTDNSKTFGYVKAAGNYNPHSDPKNPAVFILNKIGQTEPLIKNEWIQAPVTKDGTPTTLDFFSGQKNSQSSDSVKIEIWTQKPRDPKAPNPFAWKSRLSVPGGSLQIRKGDPYNFQAPTDGYVNEDVIEMTETSPKWGTDVEKNYYFKFSDGRYARATIEFYIGGFQNVCVTSYLNPQPSHTNLEYDTNQATTPTAPLHP
jgi:hypothetical protein